MSRAAAILPQLAKFQAASIAATVVDFGMMIALVEIARVPPALATLCGAACGAVTNFTLGRQWAFRDQSAHTAPGDKLAGQALRYAIVSGASACWNSAGEWLATRVFGIQYVVARLVIAIAVSFAWNYPMQKYFVFKKAAKA